MLFLPPPPVSAFFFPQVGDSGTSLLVLRGSWAFPGPVALDGGGDIGLDPRHAAGHH